MSNQIQNGKTVSIIIPVYAVENFIEKCLLSILKQTYKNFQCIVVDDGSPDNSITIGKKVVSDDERFEFLSKNNGGLSDARNFGLKYVKGDYICFLDSDDYYSEYFIEEMLSSILSNGSDISICNTVFISEKYDIIKIDKNKYSDCISGELAFIDVMISKSILCIVPNKLFKRSVFDGISFPLGVYYEDRATTYKLFLAAQKVSFVQENLFYYVQRKGSITNSLKQKNIEDRIKVMKLIYDYFLDQNILKKYHEEYLICYILNIYLAGASMIVKNNGLNYYWYNILIDSADKKIFNLKNIFKVRRTGLKKMLALLVLRFNFTLFFLLYKSFLSREL